MALACHWLIGVLTPEKPSESIQEVFSGLVQLDEQEREEILWVESEPEEGRRQIKPALTILLSRSDVQMYVDQEIDEYQLVSRGTLSVTVRNITVALRNSWAVFDTRVLVQFNGKMYTSRIVLRLAEINYERESRAIYVGKFKIDHIKTPAAPYFVAELLRWPLSELITWTISNRPLHYLTEDDLSDLPVKGVWPSAIWLEDDKVVVGLGVADDVVSSGSP